MIVRALQATDHKPTVSTVNGWWDGRNVADKLPRLFFDHFQDTSFAVEEDGETIAFLVRFVSQFSREEAYIRFAGVHPEHRGRGIGRRMYEMLFENVRQRGCERMHCITSPVNRASISFHTEMGFGIELGDREVDGVSVHSDYDGDGKEKVVLVKALA